jgi:hypothetical protein
MKGNDMKDERLNSDVFTDTFIDWYEALPQEQWEQISRSLLMLLTLYRSDKDKTVTQYGK